jgi:hypothetical protein
MTFSKRLRRLLMAVILLAAGVCFVGYFTRHQPIARIALPDGSELRLEYVTYGTDNRIPGVSRPRKWAADLAARWLHREVEDSVVEYVYPYKDKPTLVFWFSRYFADQDTYFKSYDSPTTGPFGLLHDISVRLLEDADWQTEIYGGVFNPQEPLPNVAVGLERFDRRKSHLRLRVEMMGQIQEITLPNPAAKIRFPEWQPEPLPQSRRVGGHELVLRSLNVYVGDPLLLVPDFHILDEGKPSEESNWAKSEIGVRDVAVSDATGNVVESIYPYWLDKIWGAPVPELATRENIPADAKFLLPFTERAWKVQCKALAPIPGDDGQTLGPLPMPGPGEHVVQPLQDKDPKRNYRFLLLFGEGRYIWRNGVLVEKGPVMVDEDERRAFFASVEAQNGLVVNTVCPLLVILSASGTDAPADQSTDSSPDGHRYLSIRVHGEGRHFPVRSWQLAGPTEAEFRGERLQVARANPLAAEFMEGGERIYKNPAFPVGAPIEIRLLPLRYKTFEFFIAPPSLEPPGLKK